MPGPPPPLLLVAVSRLWVPLWAAAAELTGALAPLKEVQPWAVPSSKPYCATTCALTGALQSRAHRSAVPKMSRDRNERQKETCADRNIMFPPPSHAPRGRE